VEQSSPDVNFEIIINEHTFPYGKTKYDWRVRASLSKGKYSPGDFEEGTSYSMAEALQRIAQATEKLAARLKARVSSRS
jgi:hypothetical protein